MAGLTRRRWLMTFSMFATAVARPLGAIRASQGGSPPVRVRSLNHFGIAVSDPARSIDFYQGLFGMPVQARQGTTTLLRVGNGPQFLSLRPVDAGEKPRITHFGLGVERFDVDEIIRALGARGVTKADTLGPMRARVGEGGAGVTFGDPDGIVCRLHDATYCGGSGPLGTQCSPTESPKKGLIALSDLNHLTVFSGDAARANSFYKDLFGFSIRSYQGPAPTLAVGPTVQFLMVTGGAGGRGGAAPRPAAIDHVCFSLEGFNADQIIKTLESYGLKPAEAQGRDAPLRHYVTMRMPNRGGAPGGTPELYFTDPDTLPIQLQDASYCGGSGVLGSECPRA